MILGNIEIFVGRRDEGKIEERIIRLEERLEGIRIIERNSAEDKKIRGEINEMIRKISMSKIDLVYRLAKLNNEYRLKTGRDRDYNLNRGGGLI